MKVVMKAVYDDGKHPLNPGDIGEFDDAEGQRLIDVGGAPACRMTMRPPALLEEIAARDQKLADAAAAKAAAKAAK